MTDEEMAEEYRKDLKSKFFLSEPQLDLACQGFKDGYNKANEWHYVKDGKPKDNEYVLIYTDLKNTYVARIPTEKDYFVTRRGGFVQMSAVIAWKEIVLPKESE